jgi:hypothetical protein
MSTRRMLVLDRWNRVGGGYCFSEGPFTGVGVWLVCRVDGRD